MIKFQKTDDQFNFDESVFPSVILNEGQFETIEAVKLWVQAHLVELEAELSNSGAFYV